MTAPAGLLDAARSGDASAFEQLVAPYRAELQVYFYQMLGSLHDAEDAVQDSLLRAWRSIGRLNEHGFVRAWLYKIATNRCLTAIDQRRRRELPAGVTPGSAPALQNLSAVQRAALILREVLGFSAAEVAVQLSTSTAAINSALQRARKAISSAAPTQQTVLRDLGDAAVDDIAARWADAVPAHQRQRPARVRHVPVGRHHWDVRSRRP